MGYHNPLNASQRVNNSYIECLTMPIKPGFPCNDMFKNHFAACVGNRLKVLLFVNQY